MASILMKSQSAALVGSVKAKRSVCSKRVVCRVAETENVTKVAEAAAPVAAASNFETGFVGKDTAGQANMYPVMTRAYEVGSGPEDPESANANSLVAVVAGSVAIAAVALGLFTSQSGGPEINAEAFAQFSSLTVYASKFSAELGL